MTQAGIPGLPPRTERALSDLVEAARTALGDQLEAIVLYGSAAEGRLRPTSDVNTIFVLKTFDRTRLDGLRDALRLAHAAIRLTPMLIVREEIPLAAEAFAVKFADIARRRRVLFGNDPFATLSIPRDQILVRLSQVLLNLQLRLRSSYMTHSMFEEQLVPVVADTAGPLRSAAATLLELERRPAANPKAALLGVVESLNDPRLRDAVRRISEAREQRLLPGGAAPDIVLALIDLAAKMHERARALRDQP